MINIKKREIFIVLSIILLLLIPLIHKGMSLSQIKEGNRLHEQKHRRPDGFVFPYTLTHPSRKFKLPHCLDEISGLSYFGRDRLACIQDEKGMVYLFDVEKGEVAKKCKFGDGNDYEDIEIVEKNAYILQSNGTIIEVGNFDGDAPEVKEYDTRLSEKNDAEGLAFDAEENLLLIACKDSPQLKKKRDALKGKRAIYGFDLNTKGVSKKPVCIIDEELLKDPGLYPSKKRSLLESIIGSDPLKGDIDFRPSGIAIHPITKDIYIISSVARMLIVLNQDGAIVASEELDKKVFKQPEGICFNPAGDLFISNERNGGRATILRFDYK